MANAPCPDTHIRTRDLIGLPGIPTSTAKSEKDKIRCIERHLQTKLNLDFIRLQEFGAPKAWLIASLPLATQKALARSSCKIIPIHAVDKNAAQTEAERLRREARAQSLEMFHRLPQWQQDGATAKLLIIQAADRFIADNKLPRKHGQDVFAHEYNLRRIDVAHWVTGEITQLHPGTLRNWISAEYELGMMGLVDLYGNRKGQSKIETNEQLKNTLIALMLDKPHVKACHANEFLRAHCPDAPFVSDKSVQRYMDAWKKEHAQEFMLATNPDSFKNKSQAAFGSRSENIDGPNLRWEIDATPADLLLIDGRYKIIGIIDVGPRRLDLYVTKTERARDNAHSVRRCLLKWGVPALLKTDNGTYKGDAFKQVLRALDIEQQFCRPFSGDEKPFIERAFRTFSHDLVELLPGYIGHNVAERKDIEARKSFAQRLRDPDAVIEIKMTGEQLQALCDRWLATYHNAVHSSLGKTPNQVVAAWPLPLQTISDERALDILLAEAPRRRGKLPTVQKNGINLDKGWYIHADLHNHIGEEVRVHYDPIDLGRIIVYAANEAGIFEFVCIAEDPSRTGISRAEVAAVARARQAQHKAEMQRHAKEAKKQLKNVDIVDTILQHREQQQAERERNVIQMPRSTVEYTSAGLHAAGEAARALDGKAEAPLQQAVTPTLTPAQEAIKERMKAEMEQSRSAGVASLQVESAKARYKRMQAIREKLDNREDVSVEEFAELRSYEQTNEYRAMKGLEEDARAVK